MAELIGSATIRVTADTTAAARAIRRFATQGDGQLRTLQSRITSVSREMARIGDRTIGVSIDDRTARGVASVRATVANLTRLGPVRIAASVDADPAATTAAAAALRDLQQAARGTGRALGSMATRATTATAALVALGAAARSLRGDMDSLDGSIRRTGAGMGGLRGRLGTVSTAAAGAGSALGGAARAALLLAPALVPIAAQALPVAANVGAATVAVIAFAAAAAGQVSALSEASDAEKKYAEALREHGAGSREAAQAQLAYARTVADMPAPTRKAAAALSSLKDQYREWSDSLADNTMPVATKAFQTFGALFPKLTPVVQATSGQLERFVTIAAGGVASPGFDRFMQSFATFSEGVLSRANDGLIRFIRSLETGNVGGGISAFMDYARQNGPLVRDTLAKISEAVGNIIEAAANVGPGLLTVVNALAGLVAAVPPGTITVMLQLAVAIKAVRLAAAGYAATSAAVTAFATAVGGMRAAAAGAAGVLPRLGAAFMALSRTVRLAVAGTGIGLVAIALSELSQIGRQASPDVDRLTRSLEGLGSTGKATGYAAKEFGTNFEDLREQIDRVIDPSVAESINNWGADVTGGFLDAGADTEKFKASIDAVDQSLADMVAGGKAQQAAAAIKVMTKGMNEKQLEVFTSGLGDYREGLANLAREQEVAADAAGVFGAQAQMTSAKLDAQKVSADGLRQAIQALNDVNRAGLGAMNAFEQAVDDTAKAARENAGSLRFVGGELDLNSQKARDAEAALRDLAAKTDEAAGAAREQGRSWETVNGIYDRGRQKLIESAMQMGLTRQEAKKLADQILKTPDKTAKLKGDKEDLEKKLAEAKRELKRVPDSRKAKVRANIDQLERQIAAARRQLDGLNGKTATTYIVTHYSVQGATGQARNLRRLRPGSYAKGGRVGHYASGGPVTGFPGGGRVVGPGTSTSDDVPIMASNGEYVINAASTRKHLALVEAINDDRLGSSSDGVRRAASVGASSLASAIVSMMRGTLNAAAERARSLAATAVSAISRDIGRGLVAGLQTAMPKVAAAVQKTTAAARAGGGGSSGGGAPKTGFAAAVAELQRLVDSGRWTRKGSLLFEDVSFQGMSANFAAQQMRVADGFWAAVNEIKRAVKSGKRVFEDMTYRGMSANVQRFHDMIAQIWKGNPYGKTFGDWGNFGAYQRYGKYAGGGLITGPGSGTSDRIPVWASNREFIVNARATARSLPLLQAINSGQITAGVGGGRGGDVHYHLSVTVQNSGVLGSQQDVTAWFTRTLDDVVRTGRLPAALRAVRR